MKRYAWIGKVAIPFLVCLMLIPLTGALAQDIEGECDPPPYETPARIFSQIQATGRAVWHKDYNTGCSFSDHYLTISVDADPTEITDAKITMTNWDVDYNSSGCPGGPEVDYLYINGNFVGQLRGANNSWSTNVFAISSSYLIDGVNNIYINTDAPGTGCWCVGVGYVEISGIVGFQVIDYTPDADQENVRWDSPGITVTFSREIKAATANGDTIILDYRDQGGSWVKVNTTIALAAPDKVTVTPDGELKDGIRYRMRVLDGPNGVLDKDDNALEEGAEWFFWTMVDLDGQTANVFKPNTTKDKMQITWFNVVRNKPLVPIKWVVNRIYALWEPKDDVYDADEVTEFKADVTLEINGSPNVKANQTLKRPDLYTENEKRNAGNTVNFSRLGNTSSKEEYKLKITPRPQEGTAKTFEKEDEADIKASSPSINFNYYVCNMADWFNGGVAGEVSAAKQELGRGKTYTHHTYPVLGVNGTDKGAIVSGAGGFNMQYTTTKNSAWWGDTVRFVKDLTTNVEREEILQVINHLTTLKPAAHKYIIGLVPDGALPGANGVSAGSVILLAEGGFNASTVAHEIGHQYDIAITTGGGCTNEHNNDGSDIEGFNVYRSKNKSYAEGNGDVAKFNHTKCNGTAYQTPIVPLMNKWGMDTEKRWIKPENYVDLQTDLIGAAAAAANIQALTGDYLIISGSIDNDGEVEVLVPAYRTLLPHVDPPSGTGYTIELFSGPDGTGDVLFSDEFNTEWIHIDGPVEVDDFDSRMFAFSIPFDDAGESYVITDPFANTTTINKTDYGVGIPTAAFTDPTDGATLTGTETLTWTGSDDGGTVYYRLEYSPDGTDWIPISNQMNDVTTFTLDTTLLPSGEDQKLALIAYDGFNTYRVTIDISIDNDVTVTNVSPVDNDTGVSLRPTITADFATPMDADSIDESSFLLLQGGTPVAGTVRYIAGSQQALFTPDADLIPNTSYTARLVANALVDDTPAQNTLAGNYEWRFTTETPTVNPQVVDVSPANGTGGNPVNGVLQATFSEALDPTTVDVNSFTVVNDVGVGVVGTVSYNPATLSAVFVPDSNLAADTTYMATLTTAVTDAQGDALEADYSWQFTTGSGTIDAVRIVDIVSDRSEDSNNDGQVDQLYIAFKVEVLQTGTYNLNCQLRDSAGQDVAWNYLQRSYGAVGVYTVELSFAGSAIYDQEASAPFEVASAYIYSTADPNIYYAYPGSYTFYPAFFMNVPTIAVAAGTDHDNFIDLADYTHHSNFADNELVYTITGNTAPLAGVSIDTEHHLDITPAAGFSGATEVTVRIEDPTGDFAVDTFRVYVLGAYAFGDAGWYLVSLPIHPANPDPAAVLAPVDGLYGPVWGYQNDAWSVYNTDIPELSDMQQMAAGDGYWIPMNAAADFSIMGESAVGEQISLNDGWNLVGFNADEPYAAADALASIAGRYQSVWVYMGGVWKVYDPNNPAVTTLNNMEPGYGYWINANQSTVWTMP